MTLILQPSTDLDHNSLRKDGLFSMLNIPANTQSDIFIGNKAANSHYKVAK